MFNPGIPHEESVPVLIPIRDENPRRSYPIVTLALLVANVVLHVYQLTLGAAGAQALVAAAGAIPIEISHLQDLVGLDRTTGLLHLPSLAPLPLTVLTSMFLHGDLLHLAGNMWFLWLFGDNVEDRLGKFRFLTFYLLAGVGGALAQVALDPASTIPMIGASGAIAGVLGGYVILFPHARVVSFVAIPFLWHMTAVPAWIFLGIWFVGQFFIGNSGIAWMAHVGGFIVGMLAVKLLARPAPPHRRASW